MHTARTEEMRNTYKIFVGRPEGRDDVEDLGVGKIKLFLCF